VSKCVILFVKNVTEGVKSRCKKIGYLKEEILSFWH